MFIYINNVIRKTSSYFFSNIYHHDNPTQLELEYLKLHMEAVEKNDLTYLLNLYRLAEKEKDEEVKDLTLSLLIKMEQERMDNSDSSVTNKGK